MIINNTNVSDSNTQQINQREEQAALKIQKNFRGFLGRKVAKFEKRQVLPYPLFEQAKTLLKNRALVEAMPRTFNGKTKVFLPKDIPIVFKNSGMGPSIYRFEKMRQARQLCDRFGYTHLTIPRSKIHDDFIIEERVPLGLDYLKAQIGFYLEHKESCTQAIQEFTDFCCHAELGDVICTHGDWSCLGISGRYDNVPFFKDKDQIKIALIDLEHFSNWKSNAVEALKTAVTLFPYHLDEILRVGEKHLQKLTPALKMKALESITATQKKSRQFFKVAYEDHAAFLHKHSISNKNPSELVKLTDERKKELFNKMKSFLRLLDDFSAHAGCLGNDAQQILDNFETRFSLILEKTEQFLQRNVESYIKIMIGDTNEPTTANIACSRTLIFEKTSKPYIALRSTVQSQLDLFQLDREDSKQVEALSDAIIDFILNKMKGHEIAFYEGSNHLKFIFC